MGVYIKQKIKTAKFVQADRKKMLKIILEVEKTLFLFLKNETRKNKHELIDKKAFLFIKTPPLNETPKGLTKSIPSSTLLTTGGQQITNK